MPKTVNKMIVASDYASLGFERSPVASLLVEYSPLQELLTQIQKAKIQNAREYLINHPAALLESFVSCRILAANASAYALSGTNSLAKMTSWYQQFYALKFFQEMLSEFLAIMIDGAPATEEYKLKLARAKVGDVQKQVGVLFKGKGRSLTTVITLFDITQQKKLEKYLRKMAQVDSLTGLWNHEAIEERLEQEISRAKRHGQELSCLMIDVDHFKWVNDQFGHQKGDQMIQHAAKIIKQNVRRSDVVGRYGGDEFLVILPETKPEQAVVAALRIQKYFQLGMTQYLRQDQIHNALSIGICGFPEKGISTSRDLIAKADEVMYKAKKSGGDRILHPRMRSLRQ